MHAMKDEPRQVPADRRRLDSAWTGRRLLLHRRPFQPGNPERSGAGRGGHHCRGHLRRLRRHPEGQAEPDRRGVGVRHRQGQAHRQHSRLPAGSGGDDRGAGALPHLRQPAGTRRQGPAPRLLRRDHPRPLLPPPVLRPGQVRQDLRRRGRAPGLVPVRARLQGAGDPQRLRHGEVERRHSLAGGIRARLPRLFRARFLGRRRFLQGAVGAGPPAHIRRCRRPWPARLRGRRPASPTAAKKMPPGRRVNRSPWPTWRNKHERTAISDLGARPRPRHRRRHLPAGDGCGACSRSIRWAARRISPHRAAPPAPPACIPCSAARCRRPAC